MEYLDQDQPEQVMLVIGLDQEQMEKEMFEVGLVVLILVDHLKLYKICFFDFHEEKISSVKSELLRDQFWLNF
jgi:hypothetical protein